LTCTDEFDSNWGFYNVRDHFDEIELCVVKHDDGSTEWAVVEDVDGVAKVFPTCVAFSLDSNESTFCTDYICGGGTTHGFPANIKSKIQIILDSGRNNYQHFSCPTIQDFCETPPDWIKSLLLSEPGISQDDVDNICSGDDSVVRYVSKYGARSTCTSYTNVGWEADCPTDRRYHCGNMVNADGELYYGWPGQSWNMIEGAMSSPDKIHPNCSSNLCMCSA